MGFTWWQFMLIAVVVLLVFGRGKISEIMGDVAYGIKSFRKGLRDDEEAPEGGESVKSVSASTQAQGEAAQASAERSTATDKAS